MNYFTAQELNCPCCHTQDFHPDFLPLLIGTRKSLGIPMPVTSAYRCPNHNRKVGGAPHSYHTTSLHGTVPRQACALDFLVQSSRDRALILRKLLNDQAWRIGVYNAHLHIDAAPALYAASVILWHGTSS